VWTKGFTGGGCWNQEEAVGVGKTSYPSSMEGRRPVEKNGDVLSGFKTGNSPLSKQVRKNIVDEGGQM